MNWSTRGGEKGSEAALIQRVLLPSRGSVRKTQINNRIHHGDKQELEETVEMLSML